MGLPWLGCRWAAGSFRLVHDGLSCRELLLRFAGSSLSTLGPVPWFAGNLLSNAAISQLCQLLPSSASCTALADLDLSHNAKLSWACAEPLAALLAGGSFLLSRLCLSGVALGPKGAALLAGALPSLGSSLQVRLPASSTGWSCVMCVVASSAWADTSYVQHSTSGGVCVGGGGRVLGR